MSHVFISYPTSKKLTSRKSMAGYIEKELDGALPCWDDMVCAERV